MNVYRYRADDISGTIRLLDRTVETTVRLRFSRWTYEIPYADLNAHPVRMWATPSSFWVCAGIGVLGVGGAISELLQLDDRHMPLWLSPLVLIGSLGLLWFAYKHRREEWVIFRAENGARVSFCHSGRDAEIFPQFTAALIDAIRRHSDDEGQ